MPDYGDVVARLEKATVGLDTPFVAVDLTTLRANAADLERRAAGRPIRVASKSVRCRAVLAKVLGPDLTEQGGFRGIINGKAYRQQPSGLLQGYSDNVFFETNNHGRIFGPAPVATPGGYVWSGTFSEEEWGTYQGRPAHLYVSSNVARDALAAKMVASGRATCAGQIALDNAYTTDTVTTGDHDGHAAVLILT